MKHGAARAKKRNDPEYVLKSLLAGGVAGCVAKTVTAPLDRVKILFQGVNEHYLSHRGTWGGAFRVAHDIGRTEGLRGLYRGHSATLARIFPYAAINFVMFEQIKRYLVPDNVPVFPLARLVSGSLAGASAVFVTYPLDLVRARMAFEVKSHRYGGLGHTIRTIVHESGVGGLYRGFMPTLWGIGPYAGVSFYTYDTAKQFVTTAFPQHFLDERGQARTVTNLLCGACAGALAQSAAYPFDVVRRQMQLHDMMPNVPRYRGTMHAIRHIVATEGVRGLFVGLSINYVKVVPTVALSFTTYEALRRVLEI